MRERNANQPKTKASSDGATTTSSTCWKKCSEPCQYQGSFFQSRNTMKSGRMGSPYTPSLPMARIRYMPIAYPPSAKKSP